MKKLSYKCKLLSDIILNVKSASEGNNETLDFIPGNNFLGVVAASLPYDMRDKDTMEIFHSGHVRFGDAHPTAGNSRIRSLKVPAQLFYPKLSSSEDVCFLHYLYSRDKDIALNGCAVQMKQCRNGFYSFEGSVGWRAVTNKVFAIKSAYDQSKRRSLDEAMYGYESLCAGTEMFFDVEVDDEALCEKINSALVGKRHVGRSRSAQYGTVMIEPWQFDETVSNKPYGGYVTVYADARLIFMDKTTGLPHFRPTAEDLGLGDGEIDWMKSQIRTFQYSPWNGTRKTHDADRCGIEKGSVFVVTGCTSDSFISRYIGSYNNEGFGKVIYNPDFLLPADDAKNGEARYTLASENPETTTPVELPLSGTPLLDYLGNCKKYADNDDRVYRTVNDFVDKHQVLFDDGFASQWGKIRTLAYTCSNKNDLIDALFKEAEDDDKKGYLVHGVASEKWKSKKRITIFKEWCLNLPDDIAIPAIVNLASEMSKMCKK